LHLIDAGAVSEEDPLRDLATINKELECYGSALSAKPRIVVLNKMDLPGAGEKARLFRQKAAGPEIIAVSALTGQGMEELVERLVKALAATGGREKS
jgi:GTP-binding protein